MKIKTVGMNELLAGLASATNNLPQQVNIALGQASNKVKSAVAKEIGKELNTPQKNIKKQITRKTDRTRLTATVSTKASGRIPLRDFQAKQTKAGVSAKVSKRRGKKTYTGNVFIIDKFGKHVFTRGRDPKNRKISKMRGVSPYGVMKKNMQTMGDVVAFAQQEIRTAMIKRIRFLELKKAGGLNWQQKG